MIRQIISTCSMAIVLAQCKKADHAPATQPGCISVQQYAGIFICGDLTGIINRYTADGLPGITFMA